MAGHSMKTLFTFTRLCLVLLLFCVCSVAVKAETIPATAGTTSVPPVMTNCRAEGGIFYEIVTSDVPACKAKAEQFGGQVCGASALSFTESWGLRSDSTAGNQMWQRQYKCGANVIGYLKALVNGSCPSGSTFNVADGCTVPSYSCPDASWTLSGTTCTRPDCLPGQTRSGMSGQCVCETGAQTGDNGQCCPVAGSGGGAPMQWCYVDNSAASSCDSKGANGCKVRCGNVTFQKGASGDQVQIYPKQALGQNCSYTGTKATNQGGGPLNNDELKEVSDATKDPAKAKSPEACLAAGMGYVTGSSGTNCVPGGDTGVTKKESSEKTNTDGTGTTSETKTKETEQTPTGGKQSETTTKTNPDGTTTTTTKTTTCADDGTCKTTTTETSKDANGNTTGTKSGTDNKPTSEFCKANPDSELCKGATDECKDHPDRAACKDMGAPGEGDSAELPNTNIGPSSISIVGVGGAGGCPAGIQLPKGIGSYDFTPMCDFAGAMRPIVLAFAWLSAALLVLGFKE